jgi:CRISPR-associated protein Cas2
VLTWVLYDIGDDRRRTKAARACLQTGLYRVQKSVFLGTLADNELDELVVRLEALIDPGRDSIYAFPMCRPDFAKVVLLGQAFDERQVTDELRTLFV